MLYKPNDQPSSGYPVYNDPKGPLPAAHTDVSQRHLSDVAGPPAAPQYAPGTPMAKPTTVRRPSRVRT